MSTVLCFPGPEAREKVDTAIQLYAQGKWHRQRMMTHVAEIMDSCGVTQMFVRNYAVRNILPLETSVGTFQVIIIEAHGKVNKTCPACSSDEWGYLAGEAPAVKAWCFGCGANIEGGFKMRKLTRAATAWVWADAALKVAGLVVMVGTAAFCVVALLVCVKVLGL